jgi:hypothetical protein
LRQLNARKPVVVEASRLILKARNEFMEVTAVFEGRGQTWRCVEASVPWVKATPFRDLKNDLLRRGFTWEWLRPSQGFAPVEHPPR